MRDNLRIISSSSSSCFLLFSSSSCCRRDSSIATRSWFSSSLTTGAGLSVCTVPSDSGGTWASGPGPDVSLMLSSKALRKQMPRVKVPDVECVTIFDTKLGIPPLLVVQRRKPRDVPLNADKVNTSGSHCSHWRLFEWQKTERVMLLSTKEKCRKDNLCNCRSSSEAMFTNPSVGLFPSRLRASQKVTCSFSVPGSIKLCCIANCNSWSSSSLRRVGPWSPETKFIFILPKEGKKSSRHRSKFLRIDKKNFFRELKILHLWHCMRLGRQRQTRQQHCTVRPLLNPWYTTREVLPLQTQRCSQKWFLRWAHEKMGVLKKEVQQIVSYPCFPELCSQNCIANQNLFLFEI